MLFSTCTIFYKTQFYFQKCAGFPFLNEETSKKSLHYFSENVEFVEKSIKKSRNGLKTSKKNSIFSRNS